MESFLLILHLFWSVMKRKPNGLVLKPLVILFRPFWSFFVFIFLYSLGDNDAHCARGDFGYFQA